MTGAVPVEPEVPAVPAVVYASWGSRCIALALDYLIVSIPIVVILENWNSDWILVVGWPEILLAFGAYFVGFHGGKRGQTFGKRALGIAVRDEKTLSSIGYARAAGRLLLTTLLWSCFWIPGIVDALWPLRDQRARSLHDKAAHTVVVRVGRRQPSRMLALQLVGALSLVGVAFYLASFWAGSSAETASSPALIAAVASYNEHVLSDVTAAAADSIKRFGASARLECAVGSSLDRPHEARITVVSRPGKWWQFIYRGDAGRSIVLFGATRSGHDYDSALGGKTWREFRASSPADCEVGSDGHVSLAETS